MSAIPFIQVSSSDSAQFIVQPRALAFLQSIRTPISPVIVAGPYRSGKSSLLNLLLGKQGTKPNNAAQKQQSAVSGFAVGGSVQAQTKGIWLYEEAFYDAQANTSYVFLDSEGLGSLQQSQSFDITLFSLSVLLSSCFVLNIQGAISESALEQLELVVEMTQRIRLYGTKESSAKGSSTGAKGSAIQQTPQQKDLNTMDSAAAMHALSHHMPGFIMCLRDFSLRLADENGAAITATQYLENALRPQANASSRKGADKNRIRQAISAVFSRRECVTLVRPVNSEDDLQRLDTLPIHKLRPEFQSQITHLQSLTRQMSPPKQVGGQTLTGASYALLAQEYVRSINSGSVPSIASAFESVKTISNRDALDVALKEFQQLTTDALNDKLASNKNLSTEQVQAVLNQSELQVSAALQRASLGTEHDKSSLSARLAQALLPLKQHLLQTHELRSAETCRQLIAQIWIKARIEERFASNSFTSAEQLLDAMTQVWTQYSKDAPHTTQTDSIGRTHIDQRMQSVWRSLFARVQSAELELSKCKAEMKLLQKNSATQQLATERAQMQLQHAQEQLQAVQEQYKQAQQQIQQIQLTLTQEQAKHQTQNQQLHAAQLEYKQMQNKCAAAEKRVAQIEQQGTVQIASLQSQLQTSQSDKEKLAYRLELLEKNQSANLELTKKDAQQQTKRLVAEIHSLQSQLSTLESSNQRSTNAVQQAQTESQQVKHALQQAKQRADEAQNQIATLQTELASARRSATVSSAQSSNASMKQVTELQRSLASSESERLRLQQALVSESAQLQTLKSDNTKLRRQSTKIGHSGTGNYVDEPMEEDVDVEEEQPAVSPIGVSRSKAKQSTAQRQTSSAHRAPPRANDEDSQDDESSQSDDQQDSSRSPQSALSLPCAPQKMTIQQLRSTLTSMDIEWPPSVKSKAQFIELLYASRPQLDRQFARESQDEPTTASKKRKGRA